MSNLILASQSSARKKLLRQIGLRVKVVVPVVKEEARVRTTYEELVIRNALKKASAVASKVKNGTIIGADTLVVCGKMILGKPRDYQHAVRILRMISRQPQWVYTGIAVINKEAGKAFTDYEKTKVYITPLSDAQIRAYLKKVPFLDKAGGFDIQSVGGIFVRRIEGCFYNVVGMPLAKLERLLEKAGVKIF